MQYTCNRCSHEWTARKSHAALPLRCPKCTATNWRGSTPNGTTDLTQHLRHEVQRLTKEISRLRDLRGQQEELYTNVAAAVSSFHPRPFLYKKPRKPDHPVGAVLKLSDWHIGEVIAPQEVEGINAFNWKIAEKRMGFIANKFAQWIETHRTTFHIPELWIFAEGDYVSGNIHYELEVTNEFPLPEQTARAGYLLASVVEFLAPHFDKVHVIEVGGDNHGRLTPKPQAKQKAANNMAFLVYTIANLALQKLPNVEIVQQHGMKGIVEVQGQRFLTEHGDTVKAWNGIPYYGMERARNRESLRRMKLNLGFDYWSMGHWHTPVVLQDILINGALSGTSEYDHSAGRYAPPAQVSFLTHRKYGVFDWVAWKPS